MFWDTSLIRSKTELITQDLYLKSIYPIEINGNISDPFQAPKNSFFLKKN